MKYKALAIDLDGTLLDGDDIPGPNIDALRAAQKQRRYTQELAESSGEH